MGNRLVKHPRGEYAVVVKKGKRTHLLRMVLLVPMELAMELSLLGLANREVDSAAVASQGQCQWNLPERMGVHTVLPVYMAVHMVFLVHMELLVCMALLVRMALLVSKHMAGEGRAFVRSQKYYKIA